jgi:hypothetical protein
VAARDTVKLTLVIPGESFAIVSILTAILDFETPPGKVTLLFSAI